jgi:hypothetical protein
MLKLKPMRAHDHDRECECQSHTACSVLRANRPHKKRTGVHTTEADGTEGGDRRAEEGHVF